jgi:hypothetical protein
MFSFHTLVFTLSLIAGNPHLVHSKNASHNYLPFITAVTKECSRLLKGCICALAGVVWNSHCTKFIEAKSAVNDFMDRTVTNVQMRGNFMPTDTH